MTRRRRASAPCARAWGKAGIDGAIAARLQAEHARLRPSAQGQPQRAADVLDLEERERLMRGIAAFYGRLYRRAPDQLLWAGFAAIAVNDGVLPTAGVSQLAAELASGGAALLPGALSERLRALGGVAEDGVKCAFETNYAIFSDLGWVHLAYLEQGLEGLRALAAQGELAAALLAGFEDIAQGARQGGEAGEQRVLRGNLALFRHEQDASVTPVFERYREAMAFASRAGLVGVPNRKLARRTEELGNSAQWADAHAPGESYGPFARRWRWLVSHAWQPVVALHRDRRRRGCKLLDEQVARAVRGELETDPLLPRLAPARSRTALRLAMIAGGAAVSLALNELLPLLF